MLPFEDGTYFLKNREEGKFIQIDDGVDEYTESGAIMEGFDFDGDYHQQWTLTHVGDGYYKIVSKASGLALTVQAGDESELDSDIVQMAYTGVSRQKWKFIPTSAGAYKIKAKSAPTGSGVDELVICLNGSSNGDDIHQDDYVVNTSYRDEWMVIDYHYDAALISANNDQDRSGYFEDIQEELSSIGLNFVFNNHKTVDDGFTRDRLITEFFQKVKITLIRTHGNATAISLSDVNLTRDYLLTLGPNALSNSDLIIYGACLTAAGGEFADNLVAATVDAGARTVIGFEDSVSTIGCNHWSETFFEVYVANINGPNANYDYICEQTDEEMKNCSFYSGNEGEDDFYTLENYVIAGQHTLPNN